MSRARAIRWLKWLGAVAQTLGVAGMATKLVAPQDAYALMLGGTLAWAGVAIATRDTPLMLMNLAFSVANFVGLLRWSAAS